MGNAPQRPLPALAEELRGGVDDACAEAAAAIDDADVLLLCTGAGWSADSGLAVYRDIARVPAYADRDLEYHDLCKPCWLEDEPDLFWGFWGRCFNDYRETRPHAGYGLVRAWRDAKFGPQASALGADIAARVAAEEKIPSIEDHRIEEEPYVIDSLPGAFFNFTSNVDAHAFDVFSAGEVRECHGNTEVYQCGRARKPCHRGVWRAPRHLAFDVDAASMRARAGGADDDEGDANSAAVAPESDDDDDAETVDGVAKIGRTGGAARAPGDLLKHMPPAAVDRAANFDRATFPTCARCGEAARPAILMFDDANWVDSAAQDRRYREWVLAVRHFATEKGDGPLKVAILEVGAGNNVTTVRCESEHVFKGADNVSTTLIRVNPDFPLGDQDAEALTKGRVNVIPVMARGLEAVEKIDAALKARDPAFARDDFDALP